MPKPQLATSAIVLGKEPRGEAFIGYRLLCPENGYLLGLRRARSKLGTETLIDLFDEGDFVIEIKPGEHSGFIKDFTLARRRDALAGNYPALACASEFARILAANPAHPENAGALREILVKGLDAWESGLPPKSTLLKCLYLYCRDEGYPAKEEWGQRWAPDQRRAIAAVLGSPLDQIAKDEPFLNEAVASLQDYIRNSTHSHWSD